MMGRRTAQDKLFAADHVYLDFVGRDTLYGYMAQNREQLFRDEDFAALYCPDNGRQSVPPSLAVSLLFLRPDAASLCGRRTDSDGQGAGQSQRRLFPQE